MSSEKRRRNGKEASCEPCRQGKVRCDHARPICGRCRRRSLQSQCYYHPAPMSKTKEADVDSFVEISDLTGSTCTSTGSHRRIAHTAAVTTSDPRLWYSLRSQEERVSLVIEVLHHLRHFSTMRTISEKYFQTAQTGNIPRRLMLPAFEVLSEFMQHYGIPSSNRNSSTRLKEVAEEVLRATSEPTNVTASLRPEDFVSMFTKPQFRLEYLGLICSIGSRGYLFGAFSGDQERDEFIRACFRCSTICLQIARELAPVNDATVWLSLDNMMVCSNIYGDTSELVWRLLGDLATDIYTMGIHREAIITSDAPFWLAECRRVTFLRAHYLDVSFVSLFNRPHHILRRYSDCKMPLNLEDDDIFADSATLEQLRSKLSPEGWNPNGKYLSTTATRLRCMAAEIREEIMEYEFRPLTYETTIELERLSARNGEIWRNLPPHLKYTLGNSSNEPGSRVMALAITQLKFLWNDFRIYQLMEKGSLHAIGSLVDTANKILEIVSDLHLIHRKAFILLADVSFATICFGVPSAFVLVTSAQNLVRKGENSSPLPPGISPSALVRSLSVFVFQLQNTCSPGEANYNACIHAANTMSRTLNEVVDELYRASPSLANTSAPLPGMEPDNIGLLGFDSLPPDVFDGFDLSTWAQSIDWSGIGAGWSTL